MATAVQNYFSELVTTTGDCWNRFWFTPTDRAPLDRLRIFAGCVSLYLLATLTPDLGFYFGENGILPVESVYQMEGELKSISYLDYFTNTQELLIVHVLGMVVVGLFTFGILTPLTSVCALVVMLSTAHRAPMITSFVEPVITMLLFYICLGPAGPVAGVVRYFSQQNKEQVTTWATVALRLIQIHLALLYVMMGLSKLMSEAWWNGTGSWWLMARPESRLLDLTGIANLTMGSTAVGIYLINFWTHMVVIFELGFAVLVWNRLLRPLLLGWSVLHWIGLGIILGQPLLAVTMIGANLAFVTAGSAKNRTA